MDRDRILADFQASTHWDDVVACISLLEAYNWDFTAAVNSVLGGAVSSSDVQYYTEDEPDLRSSPADFIGPSFGVPTVMHHNRSSSMGSVDLPESIVEVDQGPVLSFGHVRILHFDIHLSLPTTTCNVDPTAGQEDQIHECFTYPETETVGSLKQHFIEKRLTELLLLATAPEWNSIIPEVTPKQLLKYLELKSHGYNFSDNSVILRTLHLPKFNTLTARLHYSSTSSSSTAASTPASPRPQQSASETHNIQIELRISPDQTSLSVHTVLPSHELRLRPDMRIRQLRQDAASISKISVHRQSWSLNPPGVTSSPTDPTLVALLAELNRTNGDSGSENKCLQDIGLHPGCSYILYLTENHDHVPRNLPNTSSTTADRKHSTTGSCQRHAPSEDCSDDNDSDYPYDEDMDDDLGVEITTTHGPLIPDDYIDGDAEAATDYFCQSFFRRYCADSIFLPFTKGSLDSALLSTVGKPNVSDRKPLFVYLHNDDSVACNIFCQQILCSLSLTQFLGENDLCVWPWDVTRARAKERLIGWLEIKAPALASVIMPLTNDSYPVLAMIGKIGGRVEVLFVLFGTGMITGSVSLPNTSGPIDLSFPHPGSPGTTVPTTRGSLNADVVVAQLCQSYTTYIELLAPERAAEAARLARQRVRDEQEEAYKESLRLDQLKAKEKEHQEKEEEKKRHQQSLALQNRLQLAATLPSEPPAPSTPEAQMFMSTPRGAAGIAVLRFRLPKQVSECQIKVGHQTNDGHQKGFLIRRFAGVDKLSTLFAYIESQGFPKAEFKILTTYPRRDLTSEDGSKTLAECKLVPQETLTLEER